MTSKDRMRLALRHKVPDRVPVSPDLSNMIPCRLTGRPYWDIYLYDEPPLEDAYLEAVKKFGIDGLYIYGYLCGGKRGYAPKDESEAVLFGAERVNKNLLKVEIVGRKPDRLKQRMTMETPLGILETVTIYFVDKSPWPEKKQIKDIEKDWPKVKWYLGEEWKWEGKMVGEEKIGDLGIYALSIDLPVDWWNRLRHGGLERLVLDFYDYENLMEEILLDYYYHYGLEKLKTYIAAGPDEIFFQGSTSSLSVISPAIYHRYDLPFLREGTRLCKEAGIISHQHTCGRSLQIVEMNYHETDLNVMEPLERPPGGDVDLGQIKRKYGNKFVLKGNVNTFQTMAKGNPEDVLREAKWCIEVAAEGGGFILSTGDQVPDLTPNENILALVEAAKLYGRY